MTDSQVKDMVWKYNLKVLRFSSSKWPQSFHIFDQHHIGAIGGSILTPEICMDRPSSNYMHWRRETFVIFAKFNVRTNQNQR